MSRLLWLLLIGFGTATATPSPSSVVDLAGREVRVPVKVERILLGEGRFIPALAILEREDPTARAIADQARVDSLKADAETLRARSPSDRTSRRSTRKALSALLR